MSYIDLEHLKRKLDILVQESKEYQTVTDQKIADDIQNLDDYKNENAFNLAKLDNIILNGLSFEDLDEDLQNSIINAKNAGIDFTQLIQEDARLEDVKANKSDVYTKSESDLKLSNYYTKNEVNNAINDAVDEIDTEEVITTLNNYISNSDIFVEELNRQVNNLKKMYHNAVEVVSIASFNDINIEYPTDVILPNNVEITLSDNTTETVNIIWKDEGITYDIGNYTIQGVLILPLTIANSNNLYPEINVIVSGASNAIESVQNVSYNIDYGVAFDDLDLPDTISVSLFNGEIHQLPVFWNSSKYEQFTMESQIVEGIIQLDDTITNPKNLKAQASLSIINRVIESVEELTRTYVRDDYVEFDLPEKVLVNLNDNTSNEYEVDWDYDTINTTQLGEQTLLGKFVNLPVNVTSQIVPECVITFTENPLNITNVGRVADIEVAYNVEFEAIDLEETINVETFDGNVHTVNVIWNRGVYDQVTPGDYLIRGKLENNNLKNFDNLIITRIVRVSSETFYEYAWSYKIAIPNSISEMSGLASLINETINEKMIYGPYIEENDDYDYNKRKIEIRYLGATLQEVSEPTLDVDDSKIIKTGIINTYGENGIQIPLTTQDNSIKDSFDSKVQAVNEYSLRSFSYYAGDILTFEQKTLSNQILLIRKAKNNYIKEA